MNSILENIKAVLSNRPKVDWVSVSDEVEEIMDMMERVEFESEDINKKV